MDIEDVSAVERWMQLLAKQKTALEEANKREGERPRDRQSLDHLVRQHMAGYASMTLSKLQRTSQIYQSFVAPPYSPSVAPLKNLTKVYIKDLKLQVHHRGRYILLRVATPAVSMTAIMAILEDELGEGSTLQLYQQKDEYDRAAEDVVKLKTTCIIKEPYFKVMNDGGYGVRVDHVSDIIWLPAEDERVPSSWRPKLTEIKEAATLRQEGNGAIRKGKPRAAAESYTMALNLSTMEEEEFRVIKLNRSLAYLKLGFYDKAIEDTGGPVNDSTRPEKALYRTALAMSGLRRFRESNELLVTLLAQYPDCEPAKLELARTRRFLREEEGDFDISGMYKAAQATPPCLDNATFLGPVAIKDSKDRGRGLFATESIAAGDLLLCEKAFAHCFAANEAGADSSKVSSKTTLLINTHNNRASMGAQADLITVIVSKLYDNPSLMPIYNSLYHGDYAPVNETCVDGIPIVDSFLVERIMSLNVFGCPRTSLRSHFDGKQDSDRCHTCGIFITASYINHSCYGNARRSFIGDMQIVRASRDIPSGTEISFPYISKEPTDTYEQTQEKLANWGFKCTCIACQETKKMRKPLFAKLSDIRKDLLSAMGNKSAIDILKVDRLLTAIEKAYPVPATTLPRRILSAPYVSLARLFNQRNDPARAIAYAWKVLTSLGFVIKREQAASLTSPFEIEKWGSVEDQVIESWVHLWVAYAKLAPNLCSKCEDYARTAYKICIGEDETFEEYYGRAAEKAIFEGADLAKELARMKV